MSIEKPTTSIAYQGGHWKLNFEFKYIWVCFKVNFPLFQVQNLEGQILEVTIYT